MKPIWMIAPLFAAALFTGVSAQQPDGKVQLPKGQMPELGRPTSDKDTLPVWNYDEYFNGTWTFQWDVPETALSPAGTITGKTTIKPMGDGRSYEAHTEATGPGGSYTQHEVIQYLPQYKTLSRHVTDSRGFSYLSTGNVGGDMGGWWTIYFEGSPFQYKGHTYRFTETNKLLAPINYKVQVKLSIDGGKAMNYGMPWSQKQVPGLTLR